ncbi:MAG TPA: dockerin type I repeat-containing protein, partial [candidate division Zixibacteria bacterium]|nr:dockerin type I repeat-containing protein [candidate division Zixibacteria bacterium]
TAMYDPSTFHPFDANVIHPVPGYVRFGNFGGNYTAADVVLSSVRILNGAIPDDISLVASYPGFIGQVVRCQYDVRDFVHQQVPFYDISYVEVIVTGQLTDGQSFEIVDSVRFIGHLRGDLNLDGSIDISDVIKMVDYFFANGSAPADLGVADLNEDGKIDISDLMVLIEMTF